MSKTPQRLLAALASLTAMCRATVGLATPIQSIDIAITGPGWTQRSVIEHSLQQKTGDEFSEAQLWRDLERVRNFEIFQSVTASVSSVTDGVVVQILAVDRFSVIPVFQPTYGGDVFHLILGIREANFLGRAQDLTLFAGVYVNRLKTTGGNSKSWLGGAQWTHRQVAGRHQLALALQRNFGVDTVYHPASTWTTSTEQRLVSALAHFMYRRWDRWQPGVYTYVIDNRYARIAGIPLPDGDPLKSLSLRPGLLLKAGQVNYDAFLYQGVDAVLDVFPDIRLTGPSGFWGASLQTRGFLLPHQRLNLGARLLLQARNNKHQIDDLAYGGFAHIRSYASGYLRGTHGAVINLEARATLFQRLFDTFFVQSVVFYDAAAMGNGIIFSDWSQRGQSLGGGLRGAIHQIVGIFGRLDFAHSITRNEWRMGLGVSQFF